MLLFVTAVKLLTEIALMALLGQWLLGKLAGTRREQNFFYQLLKLLGRPAVLVARRVTPAFVDPHHVPLVAFALLGMAWLAATVVKIQLCLAMGVALCQ